MSTDYSPAAWIPTSHYWTGRGGQTPKWIIVHGTAGGTSATAIGQYFQSDDPPTSTHYIVGLNGEIVQCVRESDSAWGNGVVTAGHDAWWSSALNPNFVTFSIEHVKPDTNNSSALTQAQKEASFRLIEHLCDTYHIPKRDADANGGIAGHSSIDPVNRSFCPGTFPWNELWAYLQGDEEHVGVPNGWHDDGARLTAPNGKVVTTGFRWFVLTNPWSSDNWPLENEHYEAVIDITNAQEGGGTVQHFRKSILAWQKNSGEILDLWSGSTSLAWQQRAIASEQSIKPQVPKGQAGAPPLSSGTSATAASATGPTRVVPPLEYMPPMPSAATPPVGSSQRSLMAGSPPAAADPVSQRISGLEQQIQLLISGLGGNPQTKKVVASFEKQLESAAGDLLSPKGRSGLSNPKSFLRWILMIVGLLFSDVVAWAISTFLHHSTTLPVPFLTLGTVLLSGAVFLGTFRMQPK